MLSKREKYTKIMHSYHCPLAVHNPYPLEHKFLLELTSSYLHGSMLFEVVFHDFKLTLCVFLLHLQTTQCILMQKCRITEC